MLNIKVGVYKVIAGVIIGVCLLTALVLSYKHYTGLVESKAQLTSKITELERNIKQEQAVNKAYKTAIDSWEKAAAVQAVALTQFAETQRNAGAYSQELKNVFSKYDLGTLAKEKPNVVERALNSGTVDAFRLLELSSQGTITGGRLTLNSASSSPTSAKSD